MSLSRKRGHTERGGMAAGETNGGWRWASGGRGYADELQSQPRQEPDEAEIGAQHRRSSAREK